MLLPLFLYAHKLMLKVVTSCEGVERADISWATIGFTLGLSLSRCLASEPMRITILWRTASKLAVPGALVRNSSNTGISTDTLSCKQYIAQSLRLQELKHVEGNIQMLSHT
ncbi:hypothetical protein DPMN_011197 [Dreissena polymorpha]|uniref:Uncharacterized protein n=1 Tax=Dreissena polymorpha TaxID=45954 RepID=A0A9D4N361_DREPO|nr:hypothetical protein DPMN_011197 [Dreissena polymorpha]